MNYKLSHYTIFTKSFVNEKLYLVYSTRSNKLLTITEICSEYLHTGKINQIPEEIIQKLFKAKVLIDKDEYELGKVITENKEYTKDNDTLFEIIQPSAWCQLGCYYCGQKHTKDNLNDELIELTSERIVNKLKAGNYKKLTIGWFGGEPLAGLKSMRDLNNLLKKKCNNIDVTIDGKIVTNGLSLKPTIFKELIEDFNITQFEITLDGVAEFHDSHRYLKNKGKSFDLIYTNIVNIVKSENFDANKHIISIRCNVDESNFLGVEPLIRKLAEDQIHNKINGLYFISIYSWAQNEAQKKSLTKQEFAMMRLKWEILKVKLGYKKLIKTNKRKYNTCTATDKDSEMYDAYGNIYNCTEVSYTDVYENTPYLLGNLKENHLEKFEKKPFYDWYEKVEKNPNYQCNSCKLFPVCGGSCPKSWKEGIPACPPFRHSIKKEVQLQEILMSENQDSSILNNFEELFNIEEFNY